MNEITKVENETAIAWTNDQIELVKRTVCKGATNDELQLFMHVCKRTGLDPFARQIYATKRATKTGEQMVFQTSIDGYRLVASRSGAYAGSDDAIFDKEPRPDRATVTVYKMVQGVRCPFSATARWSEYYPGQKLGFMWDKMPCVMLAKVAEALALRKAFPADLSGVYTQDEMDQADKQETIQSEESKKVARLYPPVPPTREQLERYVIPFGQWKGLTLPELNNQIGPARIDEYGKFLAESARKKSTKISPPIDEFLHLASNFLDLLESDANDVP